MHEQIKGFGIMNTCISRFGIHIGWRKYLNDYTSFTSVSLWIFWAWSDGMLPNLDWFIRSLDTNFTFLIFRGDTMQYKQVPRKQNQDRLPRGYQLIIHRTKAPHHNHWKVNHFKVNKTRHRESFQLQNPTIKHKWNQWTRGLHLVTLGPIRQQKWNQWPWVHHPVIHGTIRTEHNPIIHHISKPSQVP